MMENYKLNFNEFRNRCFAIYGTGKNAEIAISFLQGYNFIGFIEKRPVQKEFLSYPVLTIEEAINKNIDSIIVAADLEIEKVIHDRIITICDDAEVELFGIHSGKLDKVLYSDLYCYDDSVDIKNLISQHDIISFDIFDTLIVRRVVDSTDIFDIVDQEARKHHIFIEHFKAKRIKAELNVLEKSHKFSSIYDEFQRITHISNEEKQILQNLEIETEMRFITGRNDLCELFNYCKNIGKTIYLVTDMYYSKKELEAFLSKIGITGYQDIFISGYQGLSKRNGLFSKLKSVDENKRYIHFGDNYVADGLAARLEGITSVVINSSKTKAMNLFMKDIIDITHGINNKIILGNFIASAMNDGFSNDKKISFINDYSKLFVAPLVSGFVIWIVNEIKNSNYEKILFTARDGYLIKKMYDYARSRFSTYNLPESIYFYSSRSSCLYAAEKDKTGYVKYIEKLNLKSEGRYVFVDLLSRGTSLVCLNKIFFKNMKGLFMVHALGKEKDYPNVSAMYEENLIDGKYFYNNCNLILELFLTSEEASVNRFDKNGDIVFQKEFRNQEQITLINEAQEQIFRYFKELLDLYQINAQEASPQLYKKLWTLRKNTYFSIKDIDIAGKFIADDSVNGKMLNLLDQV